jgi:O-antigen ligase
VRQIVGMTNGYRSAGPIGDADFYGLTLAAIVPLALVRVWQERRPVIRATALVATVLLVTGVVLTYSRGDLLALAVAMVGLLVAVRVPVRTLVIGGAVLLALAAIAPSHYLQRLTNLGHVDHSFQGRVDSQYVALVMFADHPLLGVGADNYQARYLPYTVKLHRPNAASTVHDLYLVAASETGIVGLLAFVGAMLAVLVGSWRRRASALRAGDRVGGGLALGSFLALTTYLVGSVFLPLAYPRYLWILVGLALCVALPPSQVEPG